MTTYDEADVERLILVAKNAARALETASQEADVMNNSAGAGQSRDYAPEYWGHVRALRRAAADVEGSADYR